MNPNQAMELAGLGAALEGLSAALPCAKVSVEEKLTEAMGLCINRIHQIVLSTEHDPNYEPNQD